MTEHLFTEFINVLNQISEKYRFEGRYNDVMLLFDSIRPILNLSEVKKEDKAKFLIQIAKVRINHKFLKDSNYDDEIRMLQEAQKLVEDLNAKNVLADAIDLTGNCLYSKGILKGEFKEALKYYNKALSIRTEINDKLGLCKSYFRLGLYHENKKDADDSDHQTAFEYYEKGLKIAEEENFKLEQSYFFRHLAGIYAFVKEDLDKGLEFFKKSTQLREEIGFIFSLQFAYFAEAFVYFLKKDVNSARDYFKKAYSAAIRVKRVEALKVLTFRRGEDVIKEIDLESAMKYYNLILDAAKYVDDKDGIKEIKMKIEDFKKRIR
ncbi:MAG: tetratricopeptide repeat protein [Promethearchaeota archaeon]|jgi:tetratricopeptide (TPR) repeat protein